MGSTLVTRVRGRKGKKGKYLTPKMKTNFSPKWCALALFFSHLLTNAATFYVHTSGNDTTGDGLAWGTAWRTIGKAAATVASGSIVEVGAGNYNEYVQISSPTNVTFQTSSNAQTRAFRFSTAGNKIYGFRLVDSQDEGQTWGSYVRIEAAAHNSVVSNCFIGSTISATATNFLFDSTNNTVSSPSVNFITAGFRTNSYLYFHGLSFTNLDYVNLGMSGRPLSITSTSMTFTAGLILAETNTSAWSLVVPGQTYEGIRGIYMQLSSSNGPSGCVIARNVFTNFYGIPLYIQGDNHLIANNEIAAVWGNSGLVYTGSNHQYLSNYFHDCWRPIRYSAYEFANVVQHTGANYDFVANFLNSKGHLALWNTNILFAFNWFENIEQPAGTCGPSTTNDVPFYGQHYFRSNVWVNVEGPLGGGVNDLEITHNLFYGVNRQESGQTSLTLGGRGMANLTVTNNLLINCGDHHAITNEGHYAYTGVTGTILADYNMIAGPEVTGFTNNVTFADAHGINGGNPLFVDEGRPRGPDGLPFTADDGFRILSTSPAAGWGPYGAATYATSTTPLPAFHASFAGGYGWSEATGSNYNPGWQAQLPYQRTTPYRAYDAADPIPNIPQFVTFSATDSQSGTWVTNSWIGIMNYSWTFGDGSRAVWTRWPDVSHTHLITGDWTMTLVVTNTAGNIGSTTRKYRVLPKSTYANDIFYVATSGSDAAAGTQAAPWLTVTNAVKQATAGDYIAVSAGSYTNWIDLGDLSAADGSSSNPITLVGYGATLRHVSNERHYWSWEGFEITSSDSTPSALFEHPNQKNGLTLRNMYFHDGATDVGAVTVPPSGGTVPSNFTLVNNFCYHLDGGNFGLLYVNATNILEDANIALECTGQSDFFRNDGVNITISRNYARDLSHGTANHTDFYQGAFALSITNKNIIVERNWMEQFSSEIVEIVNMGNTNYPHSTDFTNFVFRNNVCIGYQLGLNPIGLDGPKIHNNLFYKCLAASEIVYGGSGGNLRDIDVCNNAFFKCGPGGGTSTSQGWYYNITRAPNSTMFRMDCNFVTGASYATKDVAPPDDGFHWKVTGTESRGINGGDPKFVDEANYDFRLQSDSPLVGAAENLSSSFTTDFFGQPRTSSWSIGPFEATSATPSGPSQGSVWPPRRFRVVP